MWESVSANWERPATRASSVRVSWPAAKPVGYASTGRGTVGAAVMVSGPAVNLAGWQPAVKLAECGSTVEAGGDGTVVVEGCSGGSNGIWGAGVPVKGLGLGGCWSVIFDCQSHKRKQTTKKPTERKGGGREMTVSMSSQGGCDPHAGDLETRQ